ncbi:hypothetical protein FRX31_020121, partial [Thalictrum thalictroides]
AVAYIPLTVLAVPASVLTIVLLLRLVPLPPFNMLNYSCWHRGVYVGFLARNDGMSSSM